MGRAHENWIDGAWRPAARGHVFELESGACGARERWPRSGEADVAHALRAALRAGRSWRAIGSGARAWILARAAAELARDPDPELEVARRLGLRSGEEHALSAGLEEVAASGLRSERVDGEERDAGGPGLFAPHWSELWHEPWREIVLQLARGETIVWLADPTLPVIAETIARALERAGLPAGALALIHDDGETCLRAALGSSEVASVTASGPASRVRRIARAAERLGAGRAARTEAPLLRLAMLRNRTRVVGLGEDPVLAAREVADQAFGRARALSGQRPGQVGRVLCHERVFSRFTSALLEALEDAAGTRGALLEESTLVHLRRAGELGLDEGATPIQASVLEPDDDGRARATRASREPDGDGRARATRASREPGTVPDRDDVRAGQGPPGLVFTNVEEHMRLLWLGRPAPLLCLARIEDEERARALAIRIDADPAAEDLSAPPEDAENPAGALVRRSESDRGEPTEESPRARVDR